MIEVALYQPTIPPNTGNIGRHVVGMGSRLHLIGPLGFDLDEKSLRRAGLDYWEHLDVMHHESPEDFLEWLGDKRIWLITKFGQQRYDQVEYQDGDILLFGSEISGLPDDWREKWTSQCCYIPMSDKIRSYNLSNAVALVLGFGYHKAGLYDQ